MGPKSQWPWAASPRTPQEQALVWLWSVVYAPLMQIKNPIKALGSGEMQGSSRGPFVPTPHGTAGTHQTALANQSKQCPKKGAILLQIPGFRSSMMFFFLWVLCFFWGVGLGVSFIFFFLNKRLYPPLQKSLHSNQT